MKELELLAQYLLTVINPIVTKVNTKTTLTDALTAIRNGVPVAGDDLNKLYTIALDLQDNVIDLETAVADLEALTADMVWGDNFHLLTSEAEQFVPGMVPVVVASKTFNLDGGDYRFDFSVNVGNSSTNSPTVVSVSIGGVSIGDISKEPKDITDRILLSTFRVKNYVPGPQLVEVFCHTAGAGIASIKNIFVTAHKTNSPL